MKRSTIALHTRCSNPVHLLFLPKAQMNHDADQKNNCPFDFRLIFVSIPKKKKKLTILRRLETTERTICDPYIVLMKVKPRVNEFYYLQIEKKRKGSKIRMRNTTLFKLLPFFIELEAPQENINKKEKNGGELEMKATNEASHGF